MGGFSVAVVGAGASGILAAISAGKSGKSCILLEKLSRPGKKILASGNGRCNLLNDNLAPSFYNPPARPLVEKVFAKFGKNSAIDLFRSIGVYMQNDGTGRYFPATNQSSTVLKALEMELVRLSVAVETNFDVNDIAVSKDGFVVTSESGRKISAKSVVLTGGGRSYPSLGSDGSTYKLARRLGHTVVEPVPICVPLTVKDPIIHYLQGQKIAVKAKAVIGGRSFKETEGELLFTKYGLSGTAVLDISEDISIAMNRKSLKDVRVSIDMVPYLSGKDMLEEIGRRILGGWSDEDLLVGILPNKFGIAMKELLKSRDPGLIATGVKERSFNVTGTRGWNEAEFTAGGIDAREVREVSLESKLRRGLYFAGEILDVNGARGGYNLAWAWASGFVAGQAVV